jgi:hypothetical protein
MVDVVESARVDGEDIRRDIAFHTPTITVSRGILQGKKRGQRTNVSI